MSEPRRIVVLTTGRQDFGVLRSTIALLDHDSRFVLSLWVGGMHLRERFGRTINQVRAAGFAVDREVPFVAEPPAPVADAARALERIGEALAVTRPEAIVLVGDRSETLAAASAATIARVPIVHLHGGEETEGAIDNAMRHAITKLSHLHLVSHEQHAARVRQMGEDPDAVVVVGAPGLDHLGREDLPDPDTILRGLGLIPEEPLVLVTMHPATLGGDPVAEVTAVAAAMARVSANYLITMPNADEGGAAIREVWQTWAAGRPRVALVESLSDDVYWSLLRTAGALLGNSSSGVIEAPQAGVPAVNVGARQRGRLRGRGAVDVQADPGAIAVALRAALDPGRRSEVATEAPPYPLGPAAPRIVAALAAWKIPIPPRKLFANR